VTQPSGQTTPTFSNLYPPSITYGTATQTISGQLNGNGGGSIPQGEIVVVTLNGVPQNAMLTTSDAFSTSFNTAMLSVSSSPYTISFSYAGNANFTSASASSNLTVHALAVTLTGSETYNGSASAAAGVLTVSNKVNGDTLTLSGSVALASANVGAETITSFAGLTLGGSSASNYTLTGATGSATVNALAVTLTGSETYNGSASAAAGVLTVSNKVNGDTLTLSGSVTLASANAGAEETITSFAGLTLGGSSASNYTLTGATGSATVNALAVTLTGSETYNGSASAPGRCSDGVQQGQWRHAHLVGKRRPGQRQRRAAETIKSFAGLTLGGSSASNYTLTGATGSVTVNALAVTLTGSETYNGSAQRRGRRSDGVQQGQRRHADLVGKRHPGQRQRRRGKRSRRSPA